jgi:tetratricopeptide (TPR) repeat protein
MRVRPAFRRCVFGAILISSAAGQDPLLREAARLDAEHKCDEAEQYYRKALANGTPSAALFNNLGNHYLSCGSPDKARTAFESALKINPAHGNANLQLARMALQQAQGSKALQYLAPLGDRDPEVILVRAEALAQTGRRDAAEALINSLVQVVSADPRLEFALAVTCGRIGLYERAEKTFSAVLERYPDDFDVLYNLGVAAARAGHYERAGRTLEIALRARPDDVDSLYELGRAETAIQDYPRAVYLLAHARKLASQRPDIALALARAAQMGGYFGDSVLAYDSYLQLRPNDDMVRRDRALVLGSLQRGVNDALKELQQYVAKHPNDAIGFYDLARVSEHVDRDKALDQATTAVRVDPQFEPARYFRAWLLQKKGRNDEAAAELQTAIRLSPRDAHAFDLLGLVYLELERPADAEKPLRQAVTLLPDDSDALFHLGRVLVELGKTQEAQPFLDRFQKVHQQPGLGGVREAPGLIEWANLTPAIRSARVLQQLRDAANSNPNDPSAKLELASELLSEGKLEDASQVFHELLSLNPSGVLLQRAGAALVRSSQYALAEEFLERATAERPAARLDLAIARFFTDGPDQALRTLEQAPSGQDQGDYLLLKAKILDAAGKAGEAEAAIEQSVRFSIARPWLAEEAALFLVRHDRAVDALDLVKRAIESAPDDAELLLTRAVVTASLHRDNDCRILLKQIENRWPEWDRPYLIETLLLERAAKLPEARRKLQIATALGAPEPAVRCVLARVAASPTPEPGCECLAGIYEPFFRGCNGK